MSRGRVQDNYRSVRRGFWHHVLLGMSCMSNVDSGRARPRRYRSDARQDDMRRIGADMAQAMSAVRDNPPDSLRFRQ